MSSPLFSARVINVAGVTVSVLLLALAWRQMDSAGLAQSLERLGVLPLGAAVLNALIDAYFGGLRRLAEQFFVAVLSCAGIGIAIWALAAAIGANVPVGIALSAAPLVYCGTSIPLTFAGSGSREMSMILALSWSGWTSSTDAVFISLAIGVAILIASMPGAGFAWSALAGARQSSTWGFRP